MMKHFLKSSDLKDFEVEKVFALSQQFKKSRGERGLSVLRNQSWGLIFFKASTRTRISFRVGIQEMGGHPVHIDQNEIQLSRGESIEDTARVLSRYLHGLVIRCYEHTLLEQFAAHGSIPVVNALSDFLHPCQVYSDAFTLLERWSDGKRFLNALKGRKIAFFGDTASNMANSWILGGSLFGMEVALAGPRQYAPGPEIETVIESSGFAPTYTFHTDPMEAAENADVIYTDVWVSMGKDGEASDRHNTMAPYQVNASIMARAKPEALFMHCLPAHPGFEVTQEVMDSPASIVFDQAENRLHTQKAILAVLAESNKR